MTPYLQKPIDTNDKIYRLGVLGRKGGGKTCLLAALGVPHTTMMGGAEVSRIRAMPRVDKLPENTPDDHPLMRFKRGKEWLDEAETALKKGDSPLPSPTTYPVSGLYQFGNGRGRTWQVELVDYSGELLESDQPPEKIMATLRQYLHSLDGLLILVDAPALDERAYFDEKMRRLREAFASLAAERKKKHAHYDIPIALVFNKWDLRSTLPADTTTVERDLRAFLEKSDEASAHRDFANNLLSLKRREDDNRAWTDILFSNEPADEVRCFGVSAFGPSKQKDGRYLPETLAPLNSYGIQVPFVWACERRDEVDVRQYEETVHQRHWYNLLQWRDARELVRQGYELSRRFKKKTTMAARSWAACRRVMMVTLKMTAFSVVLVLSAGLAGEYAWDDWSFRVAQTALANSNANETQRHRAETWFDQYYVSPWFRHAPYALLQLSKPDAKKLIDGKRLEWEEEAYEEVRNAVLRSGEWQLADLQVMREQTDRFIARFPHSRHGEEIQRLIVEIDKKELKFREVAAYKAIEDAIKANELQTAAKLGVEFVKTYPESIQVANVQRVMASANAERARALSANREALAARENELERVNDIPSARAAAQSFDNPLPEPQFQDDDIQQRHARLVASAHAKIQQFEREAQERAKQLAWALLRDEVRARIRGNDYAGAARKILEDKVDHAEYDSLQKEIASNALEYCKTETENALRNNGWEDMRARIVQLANDQFFKQIAERTQLDTLDDYRTDLENAWDKTLWDKARNSKNRIDFEAYLKAAPRKSMERAARAYLSHIEKMNGILPLKVRIRANWGDTSFNSQNHKGTVAITLNIEDQFINQILPVTILDEKEGDVGQVEWHCRLNDNAKLDVSVDGKSNILENPFSAGRATGVRFNISELRIGKEIALSTYGSSLSFRLDSSCLPSEPPLPFWRE